MIVAFDSGIGGAWAGISWDRRLTVLPREKFTTAQIYDWLYFNKHRIVKAGGEQQRLTKNDSPKKFPALRKLLIATGEDHAILKLCDIPFEEIPPTEWQTPYGLLGYSYEDRKKLAHEKVKLLFPGTVITKPAADAVIICMYLWHKVYCVPYPKKESEINTKLTITKEALR